MNSRTLSRRGPTGVANRAAKSPSLPFSEWPTIRSERGRHAYRRRAPRRPLHCGRDGTNNRCPSACGIPATASAYSLNITVVPRAGTLGYLTVWPTGQPQPVVSTLNSGEWVGSGQRRHRARGDRRRHQCGRSERHRPDRRYQWLLRASGRGEVTVLSTDTMPRSGHTESDRHLWRPIHHGRQPPVVPDGLQFVRGAGQRGSLLAQCDGGAAGLAGVSDCLANRTNATSRIDTELTERGGAGQRGHRTGRDRRRCEFLR